MTMERVAISGPWITEREINYVSDAVRNAWYRNANVYHGRFEKAFADYIGVRYAIALPSCTSAIHLSLLALGIGPGDEVIVPDITWIASAAPITYVGATPIFADIDAKTWCLSAKSFAQWITSKTKAVIPVDLYGNMADMDPIGDLARRRGIAIIEDAAEAIGSEYQRKKSGSFGDTGVFSFHGSKTLTTGEGGMLVTNRKDVYERALFLRDHGRQPGDRMFWNREVAHKYKMSSMQAALGLAQLERIEELVSRKREIFAIYRKELASLEGIVLNYEPPNVRNSFWLVTAIFDQEYGLTKDQIIHLLNREGIDSRPFFYPLSSLPAYRKLPQARKAAQLNSISYQISPYGVNLPSSLLMTPQRIRYVAKAIKRILQPQGGKNRKACGRGKR